MKLNRTYLLFLYLLLYTGLYGQECGIIYVTPTGVSSGSAGTKANPADLSYGFSLASPSDSIIWLANGTYPLSNTLSIPGGTTIEGTFDPATWVKSNGNSSIIARDALNPDMANLALIALEGNGITNFRLQDIDITVADAPSAQITVYGIHLNGCSSYNITRCIVTTGAGGDGPTGTLGTGGGDGSNGTDGVIGNGDQIISICGGTGGSGGGTGSGAAGAGGCTNGNAGGTGGTPTNQCSGGGGGGGGGGGQNDNDGGNGGTGGGWSTPNNSVGSKGNSAGGCNNTSNCNDGTTGGAGTTGNNGAIGAAGATGAPGANAAGYFIPGIAGASGQCGEGGQGGTGGGGGSGEGSIFCSNGTGATGAGGGGGGEGGQGGAGGTGGGGSFCIYLFLNGTGGIIQDCDLNAGAGGAGGTGGTGGSGGTGGTGGLGILWWDTDLGCSGDGGNGGNGGVGGYGGDGSTGTNLQIYEHPGGTLVTQMGINVVPGNAPVISVQNPGCAFSEVLFSSPASGAWNFGTGANPASATGTGPFSVTYSSLGRKTVVFSGTTFTEYVHIFNTGVSGNYITPQDTTVVLGCPESFSSTLTGDYYEWWFSGGTSPDTLSDSSFQSIDSVYFNAPGVYTLVLKVTTGDSCCGVAFDTTTVTVNTSAFSVAMVSSIDTICEGDTMIFSASGAYASYEFFVNDTLVQNSASNTYTTTGLNPGDSIVVVAFAGTCYTNPSDTLTPTVLPVPTATLVSDDGDNIICGGDNITFTASPANYASYDFLINGVSQQAGVSNLFSTTGLNNGDSIMVLVPGLGCAGPSSNTIVITVESPPIIALLSSDPDTTICTGDSITFTVNLTGQPAYGFFYNGFLVQSGSSEVYLATGISDGDEIYAAASSPAGCIGLTDSMLITVNPVPGVTIATALDTICLNDANTFIPTPAGMDNYEFFVNGVSAQNSATSSFTTVTLTDGDVVSVIATDLGCSSPPDSSSPITVISGPTITVTATPDTLCAGNTVTVTATPSGYASYEFFVGSSSVQNTPSNVLTTASVNNGDTITVYASDFVCPGPQSNSVYVIIEMPTINIISSDTIICTGEFVTVTATPTGNANYDFILNGSSVQSGPSNTYSSSNLVNGDKIEVIPISALGCLGVASNSIDFIVNPIPTITLTASDDTICLGEIMTFTAIPATLDSFYFSVNKTGVQIDTSNTYSTTGITNGDTISVVAVNLGCVSIGAQVGPIIVITGPAITVVSDDADNTICLGDSIGFAASPDGYMNYEFFVDAVSVQSGTDTSFSTTALTDGAVVTVVASNLACLGPTATAANTTVNAIPATTISSTTDSICDGETITFTATSQGFDNYEFFANGISIQNGTINSYMSGTLSNGDIITVIPTDLGCIGTAMDSVTMAVNPIPYASFLSDTVCIEESSQFVIDSASANIVNYVWNFGDGTTGIGTTGAVTYDSVGTYVVTLTITDANACSDTIMGIGQVNPLPVAYPTALPTLTTILNPVITFTDSSSPPSPAVISTWVWAFGDGNIDSTQNPIHIYADTGMYIIGLTVMNEFGCEANDAVTIEVEPEFTFHVPNAFSPNQDDLNETFIPTGIGLETDFVMYIYDRWGDLIFESTSTDKPWTGRANNGKDLAQQDVYIWIVEAKDHKQAKHKFVGQVTLIR